jgi:hypothetical protein
MANFKKMDDHDFIFVNKPLTAKEEKKFSDFLKARKSSVKTKRKSTKLDVDFVGGQGPLTKKEREAISKYILEYKQKMSKRKSRRTAPKKKTLV